jgi:hypothetical protein
VRKNVIVDFEKKIQQAKEETLQCEKDTQTALKERVTTGNRD